MHKTQPHCTKNIKQWCKKRKKKLASKQNYYLHFSQFHSMFSSSVRLLFKPCIHCKWNHLLQVSHATHFNWPKKSTAITLHVLNPQELSKFFAEVLGDLDFWWPVSGAIEFFFCPSVVYFATKVQLQIINFCYQQMNN